MPFLSKKKVVIGTSGFFCLLLAGAMVRDASAVVLSDYALFGRDTLIVKERTIVTDGYIGANRYSKLGIDAIMKGNLRCRNSARIQARARVEGNVTVGGTLTRDSTAIITGTITQNAAVDSIPVPSKSFSVGSSDYTANSGEVKTISPGSYRDFHAYANSRVNFSAGTYNFRKVICEPDVQLNITATQDSVAINVSEQLTFSDRDSVLMGGTFDPSRVLFYANQGGTIYLGADGKYAFTLRAPYAAVQVNARNRVNGGVYARKVIVDQDASITKTYSENYLSWAHSRNCYMNTKASGANIPSNVTNFPVLVRLTSTNFNFSEAMHNGDDLRFTKADATTGLKYEIERWDPVTELAEVWVRVDTVKGNDSTQFIIMHWGKSGVASQSSGSSVFDTANGFAGVWHLVEASGNAVDATINAFNAARIGNTAGMAGIIGNGQTFDGSGDYFKTGAFNKVNFGGVFTASAWIYLPGGVASPGALFSKGDDDATWENQEMQLYLGNNTTGSAQQGRYPQLVGFSRLYINGGAAIGTDAWHYVTFVYNNSGPVKQVYLDGQSLTLSNSTYSGGNDITGNLFFIGRKIAGECNNDFNGRMDEVVAAKTVRSANWIKLCYENQKLNSNFITFGTSYLKPLVSLIRLVPSINEADTLPVQAIRVYAAVASRSPSITTIPVKLNFGGTATNGVDYEFMPSVVNVTVPADSLSAAIVLSIMPIQDLDDEQSDTIVARIVQDTAYYRTFGNDTVKIVMLDDDQQVPPSITLEPRDTAVTEGSIVPFTVAATGTQPLQFQWRKNGNPIPGANSPTYITPPASITDSGSLYDCIVSNGAGSDISRAALLSVSEGCRAVRFTQQPVSTTISAGDTTKFKVRVDGTRPTTFQWFSGADTLLGETDSILIMGPVDLSDNSRAYYCIASNICTSVRSRTVLLTVKRPSSQMIVVSGDLFDEQGTPVGYTGTRSMDFIVKLYPSINGDSAIYTESFLADDNQAVEVSMGKFAIKLGEGKSVDNLMEVVRTNPNLWAEFTVTRSGGNPETLAPRTPLTASPYALSGMPQLLKGAVNPDTAGIVAPIGAHFLNTASSTTYIRTARGWKELD